MIEAECECGRVIKTKDENAGKKARCPDCGEVVELPAARRGTPAKSAKSAPASGKSSSAGKSARKRPADDDELDYSEAEANADNDEEDEEAEEAPARSRSRSRSSGSRKSSKSSASSEEAPPKKKKKGKADPNAEKKILIGTGIAVGVVVIGLLVFMVMKMGPVGGGGSGGKVEVPKELVAFSSPQGEISGIGPKDWPLKTGGGSGGVPPFATFEQDGVKIQFRSSPSGASFQMMAQAGGQDDPTKLPDELKPVSQVHEIQKKKFEQEMSGYEEKGPPEMVNTKGFGEARVSAFTASEGFSTVYGYRVTMLGTNNQWILVCKCSGGQWKQFQPIFRQIIESASGS